MENRNEIKDSKCRSFINKMAVIVFSDYRLIKGFYDSCVKDVKKLNCGQLSQPEDKVWFVYFQCLNDVFCICRNCWSEL